MSPLFLSGSPYAAAYSNRAAAYIAMGEFEKAVKDCGKAIELQPEFANAYVNRATAFNAKGETNKAVADLTKAIQIDSNQTAAYYIRALLRLRSQNWEDAKSDLSDAQSRGLKLAALFKNENGSVEQFEEESGISVPDEIAELLGGREE